jgi:hypothetical protein
MELAAGPKGVLQIPPQEEAEVSEGTGITCRVLPDPSDPTLERRLRHDEQRVQETGTGSPPRCPHRSLRRVGEEWRGDEQRG